MIYVKIRKAIIRRIFYFLNSKKFNKFEKTASIISPDIIEGHQFMNIGKNVSIQSMPWLLALKQDDINPFLSIEEGTIIGRFTHIVALRKVIIRKNVLIADKVYISDNIHAYMDVNEAIMHQPILHKGDVEIGEDSWIGENVSIIGAKIGKHCIIGANSVVTKNIPDYCVAIGNPTKIIKKFNKNTNEWEKV